MKLNQLAACYLCLGVALVLLHPSVLGSQREASQPRALVRSGTRKDPVYSNDARMDARVRVPSNATWLSLLLDYVAREPGADVAKEPGLVLLAQPGLRQKTVRLYPAEQTLRQILDQLAVLFAADWYLVGNRYVLARNRQLALAGSMSRDEARSAALDSLWALAGCLSKEQWARLEAGQRLQYSDLSEEQRPLLQGYVADLRCWSPFCEALDAGVDDLQLRIDRVDGKPPELLLVASFPRSHLPGFGIMYTQPRRKQP
jgi:hypothetical protein